ncbi:MAG TPA: DnaA regulatory inactivator Hda [Gammaproteobacteria bacterium]|nr:DnaA regulatory inactivator Hda [Gammaproteobacteria bacterium]
MNNPQLPLGLALRDSARFDSFFPGRNREAVASLGAAARGEGESLVYIVASAGLGKTHLLQAACHAAAECGRTAGYLPLAELRDTVPAVFEDLEQLDLLCLDDVDAIAGEPTLERALFNLFNRVRDAGRTLLVTAALRPDEAGFGLPDLASRLGWGVSYVLRSMPEADLMAALVHRARERGLELPAETAQFLLRRFPRDLPTLFALFDTLDSASLVEQRRLTIPFVKAVLDGVSQG